MARCNLIRTAKVRCRNRVDNFIAINQQFTVGDHSNRIIFATFLLYFDSFSCSVFLAQYVSRSLMRWQEGIKLINFVLGNETKIFSSSRHTRVTKAEKQQAFHKRSQISQPFHKNYMRKTKLKFLKFIIG